MSGGFHTGIPSAPDASETLWTGILAIVVIAFAALCFAVGYGLGDSAGMIRVYQLHADECLKKEDRKFVAVGNWLVPGSGEITVRSVCVEWITRR